MKVYFVGLGGIGTSALAQLYVGRGWNVAGSDRTASPVTELLESKGIHVRIGGGPDALDDSYDLMVYSDAVPDTDAERSRARELGIPQQSYFQALGEVSKEMETIGVAGTHGKTTTTGMLAVAAVAVDANPTVIVGSLIKDLGGSNFRAGRDDLLVVEACEYRDHLLELRPKYLIITNLEYDHTDFFPDLAAMQKSFALAASRVPADGAIIANPADPALKVVLAAAKAPVIDYTLETVPELKLPGDFNRQNAQAAKAAAKAAFSVTDEAKIDETLASFQGAWRRFDYLGETAGGALVFDDYAHHPTAVAKTIAAAREKYPDKKVVAVAFQPHLYSRTKDLFEDFVTALAEADQLWLAPIFAARETNTHGVSSEQLVAAISKYHEAAGRAPVARAASKQDIADELAKKGSDSIVLLMGAGDIYKLADDIVVDSMEKE